MDYSSKFELPKSALDQPINSSSTDHVDDGGELVLCLSIFEFSQLSVTDQDERTKELHNKVGEDVTVEQLPEETEDGFRLRTFTELLNKLPFSHQALFLSTVI
ncbi:hypothetical protein ACE6H2_024584 [Prunus campanulata]